MTQPSDGQRNQQILCDLEMLQNEAAYSDFEGLYLVKAMFMRLLDILLTKETNDALSQSGRRNQAVTTIPPI